MKNVKQVSMRSKSGITPLYYSIKEDAVYTEPGTDRWYLTDLIRYNTEEEVIETVRKYAWM